MTQSSMLQRIIANWVYGSALFAFFLLALAPLLLRGWPPSAIAVFLTLPVYMLHQWEEHDNDRFRLFVNRNIGKGREALSKLDVFLVNVPGVWGVITVSFWLAVTVSPGYGLIAVYLVLVNAIVHILQAILMRRYNPGTITAIVLFLPLGVCAWWLLHQAGVSLAWNWLGLATAILIHIAILVRVRFHLAAITSAQSSASAATDRTPAPPPQPPSRPA